LQAATNANTINRKLILIIFSHHYSVFMKLPLSTRYCAFSAILSLVSIPETTCTKPLISVPVLIRVVLKPFSFLRKTIFCVPMVTSACFFIQIPLIGLVSKILVALNQ
jgi:hypothetical protein